MLKSFKPITEIASKYQLIIYTFMLIASIVVKVKNNDIHNDYYYNDYYYNVHIHTCDTINKNQVKTEYFATCK